MNVPLPHRARIFTDLHEVVAQLGAIGLEIDWVLESARQGHLQRLLSTEFDFPGHAEYTAASRGLRTLAEVAPGRWSRASFLGIPVVMNADGTVAIAVTAGDEHTGINADRDPRTMSLKGPATVRATSAPRLAFRAEDEQELGVDFWYMLTVAAPNGGVRVEVSMPDITAADDYVSRWRRRIIIGDVDLGGGVERRREAPIPPAPAVAVSRKTAG